MKQITLLILICFALGCSEENRKHVGDIPFDSTIDDGNFKACNESNIRQYYVRYSSDTPPTYQGEKRALEQFILKHYDFPITGTENGYVTIRFIVNCKGETGRFRIEKMDFNYQPNSFDNAITDQLLNIVKDLEDWIPRKRRDQNLDFYQYLTFKIEKGQITKILP